MAAFIAPLLTGGISALSKLFGGGETTQTTNTQQNSNVTPNLTPQQSGVSNSILSNASGLLQAPDLTGYASSQIQNNDASSSALQKTIQSVLASRGLAGSPTAAAAKTQAQDKNFASNTQTLNQIPMLRQQLLNQNLTTASNAFRSVPYGLSQSSTGSGTTTGNSGSPVSQGLSGFVGSGGISALQKLFSNQGGNQSNQGLVG